MCPKETESSVSKDRLELVRAIGQIRNRIPGIEDSTAENEKRIREGTLITIKIRLMFQS